jgi:hypothetical protein
MGETCRKISIKLSNCSRVLKKNWRSVDMVWKRGTLSYLSREKQAWLIILLLNFYSFIFDVLIMLMNFQNRECSGSSSLCFTIWPGESTSGQCFFVSEDWYVVLDLVSNSQLYCYAIESCNYLQYAVQVEKINWVLITDQWLTILEGSSPNRLFLYVTWYLCLYLSKMNIFSVFRNLVIPS